MGNPIDDLLAFKFINKFRGGVHRANGMRAGWANAHTEHIKYTNH